MSVTYSSFQHLVNVDYLGYKERTLPELFIFCYTRGGQKVLSLTTFRYTFGHKNVSALATVSY